MSYRKAMKFKGTKVGKMYMGFSTLAQNERHKTPWFGSSFQVVGLAYDTQEEMDAARKKAVENYHAETERLLKENPNLVLLN